MSEPLSPITAEAAKHNSEKIQNAIRAVNEKRPIPEIDFTLHVMDDGTTVNTTERVIKGRHFLVLSEDES